MSHFSETRPRSWIRPLLAAITCFGALLAFGVVSKMWVATHGLNQDEWIERHRTSWGVVLAEVVTDCAQPVVGIGVVVVLAAWLAVRRRRAEAILVLAITAGTLIVSTIAKYAIRESRPPVSLWAMTPGTHWSFPSGHTAVAAAGIGIVVLLTAHSRPKLRTIARIIAVLFALAVAVSRLYLGVHYLSDVIGSFLAAATAWFAVRAGTTHPCLAQATDWPMVARPPTGSGHFESRRRA